MVLSGQAAWGGARWREKKLKWSKMPILHSEKAVQEGHWLKYHRSGTFLVNGLSHCGRFTLYTLYKACFILCIWTPMKSSHLKLAGVITEMPEARSTFPFQLVLKWWPSQEILPQAPPVHSRSLRTRHMMRKPPFLLISYQQWPKQRALVTFQREPTSRKHQK